MKFPKLGKQLNIKVNAIPKGAGPKGMTGAPPTIHMSHIPTTHVGTVAAIHPSEALKEPESERELRKFKNLTRYLKSSS